MHMLWFVLWCLMLCTVPIISGNLCNWMFKFLKVVWQQIWHDVAACAFLYFAIITKYGCWFLAENFLKICGFLKQYLWKIMSHICSIYAPHISPNSAYFRSLPLNLPLFQLHNHAVKQYAAPSWHPLRFVHPLHYPTTKTHALRPLMGDSGVHIPKDSNAVVGVRDRATQRHQRGMTDDRQANKQTFRPL